MRAFTQESARKVVVVGLVVGVISWLMGAVHRVSWTEPPVVRRPSRRPARSFVMHFTPARLDLINFAPSAPTDETAATDRRPSAGRRRRRCSRRGRDMDGRPRQMNGHAGRLDMPPLALFVISVGRLSPRRQNTWRPAEIFLASKW